MPPQTFQGDLTAGDASFAVVVSRFNESITRRLLSGALDTLREHGVPDERIVVAWTPGAFEIPTVAARLAASGAFAAVICLGAVIRGETSHDQHINQAVSHSLAEIGRTTGTPALFGVLTCDTVEQAIHRAGGNVGNKGADCALAALEMASLLGDLPW